MGTIGYFARDFLVPTAGAIVLTLMMLPVANALERAHVPSTLAALLAVAIPSISAWAEQAPMLSYTLERKLEGLRSSLAMVQEVSNRVEQATSAPTSHAAQPAEKVVVRDKSLLSGLASTTPGVLLQLGYAGVLAFMLLAHRNTHRRQILRISVDFNTRVRLVRVMRDINERVGHYLFALTLIYSGVAIAATAVLALLGCPNAVMWGIFMGVAAFVPFVGSPIVIALVALAALLAFDDWPHILAAPVALLLINIVESQFITPTFVSRRCALNTVAVFAAIALLGWMWGPIGAIVAVPLLILVSTIAAHLPSLRWLDVLLSDGRPVSERLATKPPLAAVRAHPMRSRRPTQAARRRLVASK